SEEIRVGDNDTLSARVAALVQAGLLILLSDVEGLYPADPHQHPGLSPIPVVSPDDDLERFAGGPGSVGGTGGMVTKIAAARICADHGIPVVLACGERPDVLRRIMAGEEIGTLFIREG